MNARLRLVSAGYNAAGQSVRGFVIDAQQLTQLAQDDLPPRGLTFDESTRVRDLLKEEPRPCVNRAGGEAATD